MGHRVQRTVADAGEHRLIEMIRRAVESSRLGNVGALGDDAAILPRGRRGPGPEVVSTDLLVEGTHWRESHLTPAELARRALVANLSDLAAMGARPRWFTLGLGMASAQPLRWFQGLLRGFIAASEEFSCPLIGGDLVRAPAAMIAITVSGDCVSSRPRRRDTARPGEWLCVTGDLGRARLGLRMLESGGPHPPGAAAIMRRHSRPQPRLAEAAALADAGVANAMMDLSDGLLSDAGWIARLSGVGVEIDLDALPLRPAVRSAIAALGEAPDVFAALSGEEFELLFTTRVPAARIRESLLRRGISTPVTAIGRITGRRGLRWTRGGRPARVSPGGLFDHFSQGGGPGRV